MGRTFGDKINYSLGLAYLAGVGSMGTFGAAEGLMNPAVRGKTLKMKVNSVMNSSGLRGAKAGNGLGALTLFYCCGESFITWIRRKDGPENFIGAGAMAGMLFKSTAGTRTSLVAGGLGAGLAGLLELG